MRQFIRSSRSWHRVLASHSAGDLTTYEVDTQSLNFDALWQELSDHPKQTNSKVTLGARDLEVPLPEDIPCWAYGFTYREHAREAVSKDVPSVRFLKKSTPVLMEPTIRFREYLDFETEVGLLLHSEHPDQVGYLLLNDLTDRKIQVMNYDSKNPEHGFSLAKSFPESLPVGSVLTIGSNDDWKGIQVETFLNGNKAQVLRTSECTLTPEKARQDLAEDLRKAKVLLVATGTPEGTLFRSPTTGEKLSLIISAGFRPNRAKELWLKRLKYLAPGDILEFRSPTLGKVRAQVTAD